MNFRLQKYHIKSEKEINKDNAGVKLPPPLLVLGLGLIGVGINIFSPWPLGIAQKISYLGIVLIAGVVILIRYIRNMFKREGTNIAPWETTHKLN